MWLFELKHNNNKQIKLKSCWMPPLLEASCRRFFIRSPAFFQNEPSTWIDFLVRLNKGMMESDKAKVASSKLTQTCWEIQLNSVEIRDLAEIYFKYVQVEIVGDLCKIKDPKNVLKYGFWKGHFISGGDLRHLFIWDTSLCSQVGLLPSWKDRNRSTRPGLSINKWWPNKNNVTLIFKQQHYPKINKHPAKSIKNRIPKSQDDIYQFFQSCFFHKCTVSPRLCGSHGLLLQLLCPRSKLESFQMTKSKHHFDMHWWLIHDYDWLCIIYTHIHPKFGALKIHWFLA